MSCHGRGKTKTAAILLVAMVLVALLLPATVAASGPNYPWGWFKEWGSPWVEHKSVDVFLRYLSRWIRGGETDNLQLGVGGSYGSNEIRLLEEVAEANGWDVLYVADSPSGVTTPHVAGLEATSTAKAAKADFLRSVRSGTFDISRVNLTGGSMVTIVPANAPLTLTDLYVQIAAFKDRFSGDEERVAIAETYRDSERGEMVDGPILDVYQPDLDYPELSAVVQAYLNEEIAWTDLTNEQRQFAEEVLRKIYANNEDPQVVLAEGDVASRVDTKRLQGDVSYALPPVGVRGTTRNSGGCPGIQRTFRKADGNLSNVALKYPGVTAQMIASYSGLSSPDIVWDGKVLCIPINLAGQPPDDSGSSGTTASPPAAGTNAFGDGAAGGTGAAVPAAIPTSGSTPSPSSASGGGASTSWTADQAFLRDWAARRR